MADKLSIFNRTLLLVGERSLASLTEAREPRYALDEVYATGLETCLEAGLWNFAMRAVEIEESASVEPAFGPASAFEIPSDWVRTDAVSLSPDFRPPLTDYMQEQGYWYANGSPLYVRYVSKDTDYGLDLAAWPQTFTRYVEAHLACEICERISQNASKLKELRDLEKRRCYDARVKDAASESVRFKPAGAWVRSRSNNGELQRRRWDGTSV